MGLDARGIIAVFELILYVPILIIGACLSFKHGFARKAGWIFLVILSIVRIIGGVTHIVSEQDPDNETDIIIYSIMESTGISPLLMATLGFLGTVQVSQYSFDDTTLFHRALRVLGLVGTAGLILGINGGSSVAYADSLSDLNSANAQRHAGIILYVVMYAGSVCLTAVCWARQDRIPRYRRQLLKGITATLPFLAVRVVYGALSSFAPFSFGSSTGDLPALGNTSLSMFSSTSSQWGYYLVMAVLMEYIAVIIYATVGLRTPLNKDVMEYNKTSSIDQHDKEYGMGDSQRYATRV